MNAVVFLILMCKLSHGEVKKFTSKAAQCSLGLATATFWQNLVKWGHPWKLYVEKLAQRAYKDVKCIIICISEKIRNSLNLCQ